MDLKEWIRYAETHYPTGSYQLVEDTWNASRIEALSWMKDVIWKHCNNMCLSPSYPKIRDALEEAIQALNIEEG